MSNGNVTFARLIGRWAPWLVIIGVSTVVFWPVLFGGRTMYPTDITSELVLPFANGRSHLDVQATSLSDYVFYYLPSRAFQASSFRAGDLNLWNPLVFGGHPAYANSTSVVALDPFNVLLLLPDLGAALAWRSFLQEIACLALMYLYLRQLALTTAAALVGALAYGLNAMFWVNVFDWSISGMLWLPLVCLCADRAIERPSLRTICTGGLVVGVALLASPMQIYFYVCLGVVGVSALRWLLMREGRSLAAAAGPLAAIMAIGIAITAVQLVPTLELFRQSDRFAAGPLAASRKPVRSFQESALATAALITFLFPNLAGRAKDSLQIAGAVWGGELHWQGYVGVLPFVAGAIGASAATDRKRLVYAALGLLVVGSILYTPVSRILYERGFLLYIFCMCVLAALGVHGLETGSLDHPRAQRTLRWLAAVVALVCTVLVAFTIAYHTMAPRILDMTKARVSASLATNYLGRSYPELYQLKAQRFLDDLRIWSPQSAIPLALAAAALWLAGRRLAGRTSPARFAVAAVALTAADLTFMTWTHVPLVDVAEHPLVPASPVIEKLASDLGPYRVMSYRVSPEPPVLPLGTASLYGLRTADGYDNVLPSNLASLIRFDERACGDETCVDPHGTDVASVKYVLTGPRTHLPTERFDLTYDGEIRVFRSRSVIPRASWASAFEVVPDPSRALVRARMAEIEGGNLAVLEAAPVNALDALSRPAAIEITADAPMRVDLHVTARGRGLLVLSDTYYPGWTVRVDGRDRAMLRANGVMRAVEVEAGSHDVSFVYHPRTVEAGAWISGAALALALAGALRRGRRT